MQQDLEAIFVVAPHLKVALLSSCQDIILEQIRTTSAMSSSLSRTTSGISKRLTGSLDALNLAIDNRGSGKSSVSPGTSSNNSNVSSNKHSSSGHKKWSILKKKTRYVALKHSLYKQLSIFSPVQEEF